MKYCTEKLAALGYGDITAEVEFIELDDCQVEALARAVGGSVEDIETAAC